ncbi:MAG: nucleotidyltransferase family protein [Alphaproteobacteria bacterium]
MTPVFSDTAMVLAAGQGLRMRPLTLQTPKPLLKVGGKTMLDHALDKLVAVGIKRAVVNTFYLAEQIETHLKNRKDIEIIISRETELLDTGGGIKKALSHFESKPFFALNADLPWMDQKEPSLGRMQHFWDPVKMDMLLLVMAREAAKGFGGKGDFALINGQLRRADILPPLPYVFISAQILKPELFSHISDNIFSNNILFNRAETAGKLYGLEHTGSCYHVGTPQDLEKANALLASGQGW